MVFINLDDCSMIIFQLSLITNEDILLPKLRKKHSEFAHINTNKQKNCRRLKYIIILE
jgi:hypothetical protein